MPCSRRTLLTSVALTSVVPMSIAARAPGATPAINAIPLLDIDGIPLTLSPDGKWIAATSEDSRQLCVWNSTTLEVTCDGDFDVPVSHRSVTWSPDSTGVAFCLQAGVYLKDSDVYVFELATGSISNLTEDDPEGTDADDIQLGQSSAQPIPIDLFPAWSPDSQHLVFARTVWKNGGGSDVGTDLMTIPRDGGEPELATHLPITGPMLVYSPMHWLGDDSIVFSIWVPDIDDKANGIWQLSPDGELAQIVSGDPERGIPSAWITSISSDETHASVISTSMLNQFSSSIGKIWYSVDLETGEATPWETLLGLDLEMTEAMSTAGSGVLVAAPTYGPDATSVAFMTRTNTIHISIMDESGTVTELANLNEDSNAESGTAGSQNGPGMFWAEDGSLLAISNYGTILLPLDGNAIPVASPVAVRTQAESI